ncbi:hypothetical protein D3C76_97480 [compost metagenome]|uniref:WYL domain-containing protein n=1 Tax=Pseudomonas sp. CC120222-01a TaxID=1378075 RepID=UPI000D894C3F|nr:WYL domain-containing protein [Pseudomonas sp. CC120222-01a]PVZ41023.1 putative DNA-binding transcriptional regulator YafY [Pseudomonas sp. CC120222-01a]
MPRRNSAPQERFEAIEILLLWEGRISRSRLLDLFNIHETLASRDIASFRVRYPEACEPDPASKSYSSTPQLEPILSRGVFTEYQRLVGASGSLETISIGVPFESTQFDATAIRPVPFSRLHRAMRLGLCVRVTYRSMSTPQAHERLIRPHSLIQAGPRWHVRAYCEKAGEFRDFNLGRISAVSLADALLLPGAEQDRHWQRIVPIRLVPHRDLSAEQARMVREEYMGGTAAMVFNVRASLAKYVIQTFRAAMDPDRERLPEHVLMVQQPVDLPIEARWQE